MTVVGAAARGSAFGSGARSPLDYLLSAVAYRGAVLPCGGRLAFASSERRTLLSGAVASLHLGEANRIKSSFCQSVRN